MRHMINEAYDAPGGPVEVQQKKRSNGSFGLAKNDSLEVQKTFTKTKASNMSNADVMSSSIISDKLEQRGTNNIKVS